jgi:hypothetical protein
VSLLFNIVGWILTAIWMGSFLYGAYCAIQVFQHRLPKSRPQRNIIPTDDQLDPAGRRFFRLALKAWALAIGVILLATLVF